jgi:hypothetical protein
MLEALLALLMARAAQAPAVDCGRPTLGGSSTLEFLSLLVGGANGVDVDRARFSPGCPPGHRGRISPSPPRLPPQVGPMITAVAGGRRCQWSGAADHHQSDGVRYIEEMISCCWSQACSGT